MSPEMNWVFYVVRMLFGLLTVAVGVLALYWWSTTEQRQPARPGRAMRWLTVPAVLVAVAHIVALGGAMRGNVTAATFADYLGTAMMALLFLWMSAFALQLRGARRSTVE